jgi:Protein-tyrosine-phosphatase
MTKRKVLFICVHNSARSQMAAALFNKMCAGLFEAQSAGLEPGTINHARSSGAARVGN